MIFKWFYIDNYNCDSLALYFHLGPDIDTNHIDIKRGKKGKDKRIVDKSQWAKTVF